MPSENIVYFCAKDRRQQLPSKGERCIVCGKPTVSWDLNREKEADVIKKWHYVNG